MEIQVLGSGCPACKKLFELTSRAVEELKIDTKVEYITDTQKIAELGVMSSPVLTVNDKVVVAGSVPSIEKIKAAISGSRPQDNSCSNCSCGGKC